MIDIKSDLHNHVAIGFSDYWMRAQGYDRRELLRNLALKCFSRGIGLCAVTSEHYGDASTGRIEKGSIHDRFAILKKCRWDPRYENGDVFFDIIGEENDLRVLNAQAVICKAKNLKGEDTRLGLNVLGTNQIPNLLSIEDTLRYAEEFPIGIIRPKNYIETLGKDEAFKIFEKADFIEVFDAQNCIPPWMAFGPLNPASKNLNPGKMPVKVGHVAVSNAHRIEDAGIAYTLVNAPSIHSQFLAGLKNNLRSANTNTCRYESFAGWLDWASKFYFGMKQNE